MIPERDPHWLDYSIDRMIEDGLSKTDAFFDHKTLDDLKAIVNDVAPSDYYGIPVIESNLVGEDEFYLVNLPDFKDFHFEVSTTVEVDSEKLWDPLFNATALPFVYRQEMALLGKSYSEPWAEYWARDVDRLQREIWNVPTFSRAWWPKMGKLVKANFKMSIAGDSERHWTAPGPESFCKITGITA